MSSLEAFLLGVVQGLTEFLPVSSSGHLVIAQHFFGVKEPPLLFDILLHVATLLATVIVLRQQVAELARAFLRLPSFGWRLFSKGHLAIGDDPHAWTLILILLTTTVTGTIGILFHDPLKAAFGSLRIASGGLLLTGTLLFLTHRYGSAEDAGGRKLSRKVRSATATTLRDSFWIGLAQGIAILPGISRSGSTISTGLFLGLERRFAGEYAFLISIPAIAGAVLLEGRHGLSLEGIPLAGAVGGFLAAFVVGALSLHLLLGWIRKGKLLPFSFYCWAVGAFGLGYTFFA